MGKQGTYLTAVGFDGQNPTMPMARNTTPAATKLVRMAVRRPTWAITTQEMRVQAMLRPTPIWLMVRDMFGLMPAMIKK